MEVRPPFRADQVGSLLRPEALKQARERFLGPQTPQSSLGPHENPELKSVEDACIRECIAMQERIGLRAATDGEFRRRSWWLELVLGWEGFSADRAGTAAIQWRNEKGVTSDFSELRLTGKIRWRPSSLVRAFEFLKKNTKAVPKVTLPAPNVVHYFMAGKIPPSVYPAADAFWSDLVAAYRQELKALVAAGARYIQLDDTSIAFICDPEHRDYIRSWGMEPDRLLNLYADKINAVLEGLPDDVTITLHLVSTKKPALEASDELLRKIEAASTFAPLEQLALSPQCGFASSIKGNPLGPAEQEAKLARIVEVADRVWGKA